MGYRKTESGLWIDDDKADFAVGFVNALKHTKGDFYGQPFNALPWQEKIIRDVFGTVNPNTGYRQYSTAYVEIPKKQGKSELGAAIALLLTCGDDEQRGEVYGCAADKQQASIIFDVAMDMVDQCPYLKKRIKPVISKKLMIYQPLQSKYQVLSSDVPSKHGLNISGCVFDELHTQPNRELWDVMTSGAGDARRQPLWFVMTTAGTDRNSICYEVHQKAADILEGRKENKHFYPVIYGAKDDADWTDEKVWYEANPSLGITIDIEKVRQACEDAKDNPAEENNFRQLRLNQWVKQSIRWMPMAKWDECNRIIDPDELKGRECYGGLDLSSTLDLTSFVLCFPPRDGEDDYIFLCWFWIPEENMRERVRKDHVPYDKWTKQGFIKTTEGNVVDYRFIEHHIKEIASKYVVKEIAYDRYNATEIILNLQDEGLNMIPFGQGFKDMSPPTKDILTTVLQRKVVHNNHPVLRWNFDNVVIRTDPAGNIKPDKEKSTEKIDGAVAAIMSFSRAVVNKNKKPSAYKDRGILVI